MYRLTRDDGVELQVNGSAWEAALELASLYGWKPAGTETPETPDWVGPGPPRTGAWNRLDYFSYESQRVGSHDARAFAESVLRALSHIPDQGLFPEDAPAGAAVLPSAPLPSRLSAVAEGLSAPRRKLLRRLAAFADRGAFRIDGSSS